MGEAELPWMPGRRWVRDWSVAVRDAHGVVVHFDGVLEDITEQRLADARFQAAFEDAVQF